MLIFVTSDIPMWIYVLVPYISEAMPKGVCIRPNEKEQPGVYAARWEGKENLCILGIGLKSLVLLVSACKMRTQRMGIQS